jgi:uncharacterized membrane protein YfcA
LTGKVAEAILMIQAILYFLIAIGAATAGSMTGLGGGVIIKPLLDVLHDFDTQTIGALSAVTVFAMSVVSVGRQMLAKTKIPYKTAIPLAFGSVAGGIAGQWLFVALVNALGMDRLVTVAQNALLALLILAVYVYMRNKSKRPGPSELPTFPLLGLALAAGVFLGVCSSFLSIGGGPINVALSIYLFAYDTKTAAVCSIITILFSQISKLTALALTTGFAVYDLSLLPAMVVGAVAGGFLGTDFNKKCSEATVEKAFNAVQLLVLAIAVFNMVKNLLVAN